MKSKAIFSVGTVLAALMAGACCWLPALVLLIGGSSASLGVVPFFEKFRIPFAIVALILLAIAGYLVYFRKETEGGDHSCCDVKRTRIFSMKTINKFLLPIIAVFVIATILFPEKIFPVSKSTNRGNTLSAGVNERVVKLSIKGMTWPQGCPPQVRAILQRIQGVKQVEIDFEKQAARVLVDDSVSDDSLTSAFDGNAKYSAKIAK